MRWLALLLCFGSCSGATPMPAAYRRGVALEREQKHSAALASYREAVQKCTADTRACRQCRLRLAETQARLGRHRQALRTYLALRGWTADPATAARAQERAAGLLEGPLGRQRRALALYRRTLLDFPGEVAGEDALRRWLELQPRVSGEGASGLVRALIALQRRLRGTPLADDILFAAARIYLRQGDREQARRLFDRLWRADSRSPLWDDALWQAGQILEQQRRWSEAIDRYRRLVASRKQAYLVGSYNSVHLDDAQLRIGLIRLERLADPRGAIAALQTLRDEFRDSILRDDAQWWIARAQLQLGQPGAACAALRRLVRQFPDGNHTRRARQELTRRCPGRP
jgi:tetratricopeptide (TPR) repeat protein